MSQQVAREPQEAYPLDPAQMPKVLHFDDLRRGVSDVTGSNNVCLTGSNNGGYDGLWLRVEGEAIARGEARWHAQIHPMGELEVTAYLDREAATRLYNTLGALMKNQRKRGDGLFAEAIVASSSAYPAHPKDVRKQIDQAGLEAGIRDCYGRATIALIPLSDADEDTITVRLTGEGSYEDGVDPANVVVGQTYPGDGAAHMDLDLARTIHTTLGMLIERMRP